MCINAWIRWKAFLVPQDQKGGRLLSTNGDDWQERCFETFSPDGFQWKHSSCSIEVFCEKKLSGCQRAVIKYRKNCCPLPGQQAMGRRDGVWKVLSRKSEQWVLLMLVPACRMLRNKLFCKIILLVEKALFFFPFKSQFRTFKSLVSFSQEWIYIFWSVLILYFPI